MTDKEKIIELFNNNVKGRNPDVNGINKNHDGKKGHWLERQFGIAPNSTNIADLWGYELKNQTNSVTTFGDWSANTYIFTTEKYSSIFCGKYKFENQDKFVKIFGHPTDSKDGRFSWSGSVCPKIDEYNDFGQKLEVCPNKDIVALYSYSEDKRENKSSLVPHQLQVEKLEIAKWYGTPNISTIKKKCLKYKLEDKFNAMGWFTCKMDSSGAYYKICFGKPINYDNWIELVKKGTVYFDSGMHFGNRRPYSQWRAKNSFWDSLIVEEYE